MKADPRAILDQAPMGAFQIVAVGICIFLNGLDGFDVLAISFASPGIAEDWGITRAALGVVLSMELFGMAVGSIFLGNAADRIGRRPMIMCCLIVMTLGMYLAAIAQSINFLLVVRFFTGLGIGGMLAATNAMAFEYSNRKNKNLCVMLMAAGYPIGVILGGSVASTLLVTFDWRAVFYFGALVTGSALALVWFFLPESIEYLTERRPRNALDNINRTLGRMGHQQVMEFPVVAVEKNTGAKKASAFSQLFSKSLVPVTMVFTVAYFFHIMTFYYFIKWIPKLVVDMGHAASSAGTVLVWANVGGALGAVIIGVVATRFNLRNLTIAVMVSSFFMLCLFGLGQEDLTRLALVCAASAFFLNSAIVGMYALFAQYYPASVRASGTGFTIGIGRGGAALGPVVAGIMFTQGYSLLSVSLLMGVSTLVAATCLAFLRKPYSKKERSEHDLQSV